MKYALNLAEDGRVLSATFEKYAGAGAVLTDTLPEGSIENYRYQDGEFVYAPLPACPEPEPSAQEDMGAMLVDHEYRLTLLELGLTQ